MRDFQSCQLNLKSKQTVRFRTGEAESGQQARHFKVRATRKPLGTNDQAIGIRHATVFDEAPGARSKTIRRLERQSLMEVVNGDISGETRRASVD
jgi:hypothetical protein